VRAHVPFVQQAPKPQGLKGEHVVPVSKRLNPLGQLLVPVTEVHAPVPVLLQQAALQGVGWQLVKPGRKMAFTPTFRTQSAGPARRVQAKLTSQHAPCVHTDGEHEVPNPANV